MRISNSRGPLVCVFDSGIGGLNLLNACVRRMPQADYCYFADNFRVPYGNLPEGEVKERVMRLFGEMAKLSPDAVAIACNTVTAECISDLRKRFAFPVIGMEPAVKQAAVAGGKFLVLATESTCRSAAFARLINRYGADAEVCPQRLLAGRIEREIFSLDAKTMADDLPAGRYKAVVLGCTHYVFIKKAVKERYRAPVFDGVLGTADHLAATLGIFDHSTKRTGKIDFICGDLAKNRAVFEMLQHNSF